VGREQGKAIGLNYFRLFFRRGLYGDTVEVLSVGWWSG